MVISVTYCFVIPLSNIQCIYLSDCYLYLCPLLFRYLNILLMNGHLCLSLLYTIIHLPHAYLYVYLSFFVLLPHYPSTGWLSLVPNPSARIILTILQLQPLHFNLFSTCIPKSFYSAFKILVHSAILQYFLRRDILIHSILHPDIVHADILICYLA